MHRVLLIAICVGLMPGCRNLDKSDRHAAPAAVKDGARADTLADEWPIEDGPDPAWSGATSGSAQARLTAIRETLLRTDGTFIKGWKSVLADENAPPAELHGALMELMAAVTGPSGLWRDTIPRRWLGCASNPHLPPCAAFSKASAHFDRWDTFQRKLDRAPANPTRFLVKSHKKIMAYVTTYVPEERSFSSARQTPFFQDHLEEALGQDLDLDAL